MTFYSFISVFVLLIIFFEIYFLGRWLTTSQNMLKNNEYAIFALGFAIYFSLSFLVFLPFIFLKIALLYLIVIFFIKDAVLIMILLSRRILFFKEKIMMNHVIFIILSGVTLALIFNYGITKIGPFNFYDNHNNFEAWNTIKIIMSKIGKLDINIINKWFGGIAISIFGVSSVGFFISYFLKKRSYYIMALTFIITGISMLMLNNGNHLESIGGIYFTINLLIFALNIIIFYRRRYAFCFAFMTIALWNFDTRYFLVSLVVAFITMTIYTLLKLPKALSFWTQLFAPIILISTIWINDFSRVLWITVVAITIVSYVLLILSGRIKFLDAFNSAIIKLRWIIPITIFVLILISGFASSFVLSSNWHDHTFVKDLLFYTYQNKGYEIFMYIMYFVIFVISGIILLNCYLRKTKINKIILLVGMIFLTYLLFYNPIFNSIWIMKNIQYQYKVLGNIIVLPTICLLGVYLINKIKFQKIKLRKTTQ